MLKLSSFLVLRAKCSYVSLCRETTDVFFIIFVLCHFIFIYLTNMSLMQDDVYGSMKNDDEGVGVLIKDAYV